MSYPVDLLNPIILGLSRSKAHFPIPCVCPVIAIFIIKGTEVPFI
jgi:hypothetical protein